MRYFTTIGSDEREWRFARRDDVLLATCGDRTYVVDVAVVGDGTALSLLIDGQSHDVILERVDGAVVVQCRGERVEVMVLDERERAARDVVGKHGSGGQQLRAVMPGVVADVRVSAGDRVEAGQTLVVLEAMKMQNPMLAEAPGVVVRVHVEKGKAVASGALLVEIAALEP